MRAKPNVVNVFLQPGGFFVGDSRHRIHTLLGSCVSITLWHPARMVGAMSHFLLSARSRGATAELDGRYGEEALHLMLRELEIQGVPAGECEAKVFGGGNMFPSYAHSPIPHVGRENGEAARLLLRSWGIPIVSESLYGIGHRRIVFDIDSGHVWVRQVRPDEVRATIARKRP